MKWPKTSTGKEISDNDFQARIMVFNQDRSDWTLSIYYSKLISPFKLHWKQVINVHMMITLEITLDVMLTGLVIMFCHSRNLHISTLMNTRWDALKTGKLSHHSAANIRKDQFVQMWDAHVTIILQNRKYPVHPQMAQEVWFLLKIGQLVLQAIISCLQILISTLKNQKRIRHFAKLWL